MKRLIVLLLIASGQFPMVNYVCAEDYGIKVGGVSVTSSNYNNVTGDNIKAYDTSQSYSVKYNPGTKTLTFKNVKIQRTGNDNRAIYNTGCDGLTVVLDGKNYFSSESSAPLRFEKNTTIRCINFTERTHVLGVDEDCIYLTSGVTLTLDSAALYVYATKSCGIVGKNATEKIVMKNSSIHIKANNATYSDRYAIWDIANLTMQNSFLYMESSKKAVKNLKGLSINGLTILPQESSGTYKKIVYSSDKKSFVYSADATEVDGNIEIYDAVAIDQSTFPDANLRHQLRGGPGGADGYLVKGDPFNITTFFNNEISYVTSLNISGKEISSLKGIENLTDLRSLFAGSNSITTLDLSKNTALTYLECNNNALTSLKLPENNSLEYVKCSNNKLASLDASPCSGLVYLYCDNNKLTSLKLPSTSSLIYVDCRSNSLTSLNLSSCTGIKDLFCQNNRLTSLTLPATAPLSVLECQHNSLSSLKMPTTTTLNHVYCYDNKIKGDAMTTFINSLPLKTAYLDLIDHSSDSEHNQCTAAQVALAKERQWTVRHTYDETTWSATDGCYDYDLWVNGKRVMHKESSSVYAFDADNKKLTLGKDILLEGTTDNPYKFQGAGLYNGTKGMTIELTGDVSVNKGKSDWHALRFNATTIIQGEGTLNADGHVGIYQESGTLAIGGEAIVRATGYYSGVMGNSDLSATLLLADNAILQGMTTGTSDYSKSGISQWKEIIWGTQYIVAPEGAKRADHGVMDRDGNPIKGEWITISSHALEYKLTYYVNGLCYHTEMVPYGDPVTPLDVPEDDDYYYAWEDEPVTMPAHDVEVHAVITGIDNREQRIEEASSPSLPLKGEGVYDLYGRKVANPVKGHIYICNGKKVVK